jgi:hypothetical protein
MDSDQTEAEALQVAETEVGVGIERSIGVRTWVARAGGLAYRSADSALDLGLMA